jgi:hypothetical protein
MSELKSSCIGKYRCCCILGSKKQCGSAGTRHAHSPAGSLHKIAKCTATVVCRICGIRSLNVGVHDEGVIVLTTTTMPKSRKRAVIRIRSAAGELPVAGMAAICTFSPHQQWVSPRPPAVAENRGENTQKLYVYFLNCNFRLSLHSCCKQAGKCLRQKAG